MSSNSQKATIPSYHDIAQATFGTLWPEATPQDWALVVHKLREALRAQQDGPDGVVLARSFARRIERHLAAYGQAELDRNALSDMIAAAPQQSKGGTGRDPGPIADGAAPQQSAGAERDPNDPDPVEHARELAAALIEARKELVEIRPEAARYRWLRGSVHLNRFALDRRIQSEAEMDAAIDAARSATEDDGK